MLTIRLQRTGKKNASAFRIVVAEKTASVSKKFNEVLGVYNPRRKEFSLKNPDRVQYWISQHIELSPTVHNLLVEKGILKADKVKAFKVKKSDKPAEAAAPAAPATEAPAEAPATEAPQA